MKKYAIIPLSDDFEPGQCDECPVSYVGFDECGDMGFLCSIGMDYGKCPIEVKEFVPVADIVDDVFGQMRDATEQEQKTVSEFVERISKPTGVNSMMECESCEDAISRKAAIECLRWQYPDKLPEIKIRELPSVQPKQKTGHWIMKHRTHNEMKHYIGRDEMGETHTISVLERYEVDEPYCSECGKRAGDTSQDYCCACGAKMVESEDKE